MTEEQERYVVRALGLEHGRGTLIASSIEEVLQVVGLWLTGTVGEAGKHIEIEVAR